MGLVYGDAVMRGERGVLGARCGVPRPRSRVGFPGSRGTLTLRRRVWGSVPARIGGVRLSSGCLCGDLTTCMQVEPFGGLARLRAPLTHSANFSTTFGGRSPRVVAANSSLPLFFPSPSHGSPR